MRLSPMEILLILSVLLLLFGSTRLPALGSSLGSAIRNFKRGFSGDENADEGGKDKNLSSGGVSGDVKAKDKVASRE